MCPWWTSVNYNQYPGVHRLVVVRVVENWVSRNFNIFNHYKQQDSWFNCTPERLIALCHTWHSTHLHPFPFSIFRESEMRTIPAKYQQYLVESVFNWHHMTSRGSIFREYKRILNCSPIKSAHLLSWPWGVVWSVFPRMLMFRENLMVYIYIYSFSNV